MDILRKIFSKFAESEKIGRFEFGPFSYHVEDMMVAPYRFMCLENKLCRSKSTSTYTSVDIVFRFCNLLNRTHWFQDRVMDHGDFLG